jgi:drug/metabolite transporter (DMT)-like permease
MSSNPPRAGRAAVAVSLVLVQVFFGVHYLAAKILLRDIPPRAWAVLRVTAAAAVLLAATFALRRKLPREPRDLGLLALFSIFGVVVNQVCFVEGLYRTTPTHSAILNTTIPVGTLLFALLLGREMLDGGKILSILLALGGVLLVVHPERATFGSATLAGDLLTLANALSYGFFLVISKRALARMDPLAATAVLMSFGALGILAIGGPSLAALDLSSIPPRTWGLGAFIVLFPTVGAYYLTYWALARVESSTVALFVYLQPVIAAALSALVLGERPTVRVLAGAALVFLGVYVAVAHPRLRAAARARAARTGEVP